MPVSTGSTFHQSRASLGSEVETLTPLDHKVSAYPLLGHTRFAFPQSYVVDSERPHAPQGHCPESFDLSQTHSKTG